MTPRPGPFDDRISDELRARVKEIDHRRPLVSDEEWLLARGYNIPYLRHRGLDALNFESIIMDAPEAAIDATGCSDPLSELQRYLHATSERRHTNADAYDGGSVGLVENPSYLKVAP